MWKIILIYFTFLFDFMCAIIYIISVEREMVLFNFKGNLMSTMKKINEQLENTISYYESDDFKDSYGFILLEDTQNNGVDRLIENSKSWDIIENFEFPLSEDTAHKIIDYICENFDDEFVSDYRNYYVGSDCISSVEFGEQYEEKPQGFIEDEYTGDFYVGDDGLYYDMSSNGVMLKITQSDAIDILQRIKDEE